MASRGRQKVGAADTSNGNIGNGTSIHHGNDNNNRRVSRDIISVIGNHGDEIERHDSKAVLIQVKGQDSEEGDTGIKNATKSQRTSHLHVGNGDIQNGDVAMTTIKSPSISDALPGGSSSRTTLLDNDSVKEHSNRDLGRSRNHMAAEPPRAGHHRRPSVATSSTATYSTQRKPSAISLWSNLRNVIKVGSELKSTARKKRKKKASTQRVDSFLQKFTIREGENTENVEEDVGESDEDLSDDDEDDWNFVVNPEGDAKFYWLTLLCIAIIYNFWTIILRQAWPDIHSNCKPLWFTLDYLCDLLYLMDIFMQMRSGYLEQGILVLDDKKLAMKYVKSRYFVIDLICLTPLDFLYLVTTRVHTLIRFPRLFKCYRYVQWSKLAQSRSAHPNVLRVGNLCNVILLLMHWFSCVYFIICEIIGFGSDNWVYPVPEGDYAPILRQYLASFYWAILTLTMLGDVADPETEAEYVFQIIAYLMGLFIFATIVGQIGTVIENRNALRLQFERHVDNAKKYMRVHDVPKDVQERIQRWYDYTWDLDDGDINALGLLPDKMRAELALHVNLKTLKKVTIFNECPPAFLHDLVLKMRTSVFTPGDLVCRKGEVAKEMFIISDGLLEVVGTNGTIVVTLQNGDYFGEIGILNIDGVANRRTADVRAVGYTSLFTLSKDDVLLAIQDYPQAEKVLALEARRRIKDQNKAVKRSELMKRQASDLDYSSLSGASGASANEFDLSEEPELSENGMLGKRKQTTQYSSSSDQKTMADIVGMTRPKLQNKTNRISGLRPLGQPRAQRGSRRKSRVNSLLTTEEDDWAAEIASSVGSALREKMDEFKLENKRLRKRNVDLDSRNQTLQEENNTKEEKISLLWRRVVELEEDMRSRRRTESLSKTEVCIEGDITDETQA